jgi:hypothetical protein
MHIKLPLINSRFVDDSITKETDLKFGMGSDLLIYSEPQDWLMDDYWYPFHLRIEYGEDKKNCLIYDVELEELEMFANSLSKCIEMFRRDYKDEIKRSMTNGYAI